MATRKPPAKRDPSTINLRGEHRQQLRDLHLLIQHHQAIAARLDAEAKHLITLAYGVDVAQGNWVIDYAAGTLRQEPPVAVGP